MAHRRGHGLCGRDGRCILLENMSRDQRISWIGFDPLRELSQLRNPALEEAPFFRAGNVVCCSPHLRRINETGKVNADFLGFLPPPIEKAFPVPDGRLAFPCIEHGDVAGFRGVLAQLTYRVEDFFATR